MWSALTCQRFKSGDESPHSKKESHDSSTIRLRSRQLARGSVNAARSERRCEDSRRRSQFDSSHEAASDTASAARRYRTHQGPLVCSRGEWTASYRRGDYSLPNRVLRFAQEDLPTLTGLCIAYRRHAGEKQGNDRRQPGTL